MDRHGALPGDRHDTMTGHPNFLLARLRQPIIDDLLSHSKDADLRLGRSLVEAHACLSHVYFPHSGSISNVVDLANGRTIETSLIGRDGVLGAGNALDDHVALNRVMVLVAGAATVLTAASIVTLTVQYPEFRRMVLGYEQFNYAQVQQTAACNAAHSVRHRFCRRLLRLHELNGTELNFTHDFHAQMIGVRRTSITEIAQSLASRGVISYSRGRLRILDIAKLAMQACGCHDAVSQSYKRLFPELDEYGRENREAPPAWQVS